MSWNKKYDEELQVWKYSCDIAFPQAFISNSDSLIGANPRDATVSRSVYPYPEYYQLYQQSSPTDPILWSDYKKEASKSYTDMFGKTAIFVYKIDNDGGTPSFINDTYKYQGIYDFINSDQTVIEGGEYSTAGTYCMIVSGNGHSGKYKYQGKTNFSYDQEVPENYALAQGIWNALSDNDPGVHNVSYYNARIVDTPGGFGVYLKINGFYVTDIPVYYDFQEMCEWLWEVEMNRSDLQEPVGVVGKNVFDIVKITNDELNDLNTFISLGSIAFEGNLEDSVISLKLISTPNGVGPYVGESKNIVDKWKDYWKLVGSLNSGLTSIVTNFFRSQWFENNFSTILDPLTVDATPLTKQYRWYTYEETGWKYTFPKHFNVNNGADFLDNSPYTQIKIWLPYSGMHSIDSSLVAGRTAYIDAIIDFVSGNLMYYMSVDDPKGSDKALIYTWTGNCSIEMPLTGTDYGRKVSGFVNAGVQIAAAAATENPIAGVSAGVSTLDAASNNYYYTKGNSSSNNGFTGVQYPYLIISYPDVTVPINYNEVNGRPCNKTIAFSNLEGYTEIDNVILDIPEATEEEKELILEQLKNGVVF